MANYIVDWQSLGLEGIPGKTSITLPQNTTNSASTSLVLTGKGLNNYGEIQQENFIRLLENFASETSPSNPTIGQLWFNAGDNALMYYTMQQQWKRIGGVIEVGPDEPVDADEGLLWLNTTEQILYLAINPSGPMGTHPRYFSGVWVQVWPSPIPFANMQEYNLMAARVNRIIGPSTTIGGQLYGWGTNQQLPIFDDYNTPTQFDNRAWTDLLQMLDAMSCHTGIVNPPRSPVGFIRDGRGTPPFWGGYGVVTLHNFWDNTNALLTAIEEGRFQLAPIASETAVLVTHTRTAQWNTTKTHTATITFPTAAAAQQYFNSGGSFDFKFSHTPSLSNAFNLSWQAFLQAQTGATGIQFKGTNMVRDSAEVSTFGYADLTTSFQQIYNANRVGDGGYNSDADSGLTILARTSGAGAVIEFEVRLREAYGSPYGTGDVVGTTVSSIWRRSMTNACFTTISVVMPTATQGGTFISAPAEAPAPPAPPVAPSPSPSPSPSPAGEQLAIVGNMATTDQVGETLSFYFQYSSAVGTPVVNRTLNYTIERDSTVVGTGSMAIGLSFNVITSQVNFVVSQPGTYRILAQVESRNGGGTMVTAQHNNIVVTSGTVVVDSLQINVNNITVGPGVNLQVGDTLSYQVRYNTNIDDTSGAPYPVQTTVVRNGVTTVGGGIDFIVREDGTLTAVRNVDLTVAGQYTITASMTGQNGTLTVSKTDITVTSSSPPGPSPSPSPSPPPSPAPFSESVSILVNNITVGPGVNLHVGDTLSWRYRYNTSTDAGSSGLANWTLVRNGTTTVASGSQNLAHVNGTLSTLRENFLATTGQYTITVTMQGQGGVITVTKTDINVTPS